MPPPPWPSKHYATGDKWKCTLPPCGVPFRISVLSVVVELTVRRNEGVGLFRCALREMFAWVRRRRPSLRAKEIVRRVEAAIAGAEPLFTPPRSSSTESPDRSSSPESDTMVMADREVMTLPLCKRKLYLNDNQSQDVSPVIRMNSVIQLAKAS